MLFQRNRALAVCGVIVTMAVSGATVMALPPADHLGPDAKRAVNVTREILPEGWSFFTKSPRDPYVVVYDNKGRELGLGPNAQARWVFGFDRSSRLGGIDVDRLVRSLESEAWNECEADVSVLECSASADRRLSRLVEPPPFLCGDITLARKEPAPWAFRGTPAPAKEIALVRVKCK